MKFAVTKPAEPEAEPITYPFLMEAISNRSVVIEVAKRLRAMPEPPKFCVGWMLDGKLYRPHEVQERNDKLVARGLSLFRCFRGHLAPEQPRVSRACIPSGD